MANGLMPLGGEIGDWTTIAEPDWTPCPVCKNEYAATIIARDGKCPECVGKTKTSVSDALRSSEKWMPPHFDWATLDAPELETRSIVWRKNKPMISKIIPRLDRCGLVIEGKTGAGKTSLAVALMREWVKRNKKSAMFGKARVFGRGPHAYRAEEYYHDAMFVPLLLIDDLGREAKSVINRIPDLIQERHDAGLLTWVTTNFSMAEISQMANYDEAIARRIFEGAQHLV